MGLAVVIIPIVSVLLAIATIIACFLYARKTYNAVDNVLDRILSRDEGLYNEITGSEVLPTAKSAYSRPFSLGFNENRISKLAHKASRIADMYIFETSQTKEEKEVIQGFISDMSHQMKTPLAGISMYADLLLEGHTSENEQHEFFTRIKHGTDNLQWMMDSLIKMSRLEVGAIQLSPVRQNIRETISAAIASVLAVASKKNIEIEVISFEDVPLLHDKRWTQEAIVNILENAIKYSDVDGKISVGLEMLPLHTKIIVTDYGIGIDKNDWHKIFKRFYRGKNAKTADGAGLGLYLVTLIMEKQGGYVMVDSTVGEHTTFSLFLQN